jgi:parvulin-like peptidyl-prolyl isomerase
MVQRQFTRQFMAQEYLRNRVLSTLEGVIDFDQLRDYYDQHSEEFKVEDSVEWEDIFISASNSKYKNREEARQTAEKVAERLRKHEDIVTLCKEFDDGTATLRKGAGDGHKRGEIRPVELEPVLFRMKDGEVGPVLENSNGFHVFRLVKRQHAGKEPFDEEVQQTIRGKIRSMLFAREAKRFVSELKHRAVIEYARTAR